VLGEEVASVELGRTHNLHGNGLIFLSVAVRPAAHMVTEWTGCADDRCGEASWRGEGGTWIRDSGLWPIPPLMLSLFLSLFFSPP